MPPKQRRVAITLDLEWPYKRHAGIFAGTQQYARQQSWESIIDEFVAENLPDRRTESLPYDGVIARANEKLAKRTARLGIPLVNVWFNSPVRDQLPGVFPDYAAIGRIRAEHLLARGLRRFATVVREDRGRKQEEAAFRATVQEAGFSCVTAKIPLNSSRTHDIWLKTQQRIDAWMDEWELPIGVAATDELAGRTVVQRCARRGWRVPQDVAVLAGSNEEALCENPRPSLTSTELGFERVGYEAAQLLNRLMSQRENARIVKKSKSSQHILLPPQGLVIRESTDFYAIKDELVAAALDFISQNSHRRIGQDDVSRAVDAETRTLQLRFRKVLDRPIATEIRRVRIERAKRELAQSDRRLAEIARDVGFGKSMRMYEVFRRELARIIHPLAIKEG